MSVQTVGIMYFSGILFRRWVLLIFFGLMVSWVAFESVAAPPVLRVLVTEDPELDALPRTVAPDHCERALLAGFAETAGFLLEFVECPNFSDLIPALLDGKGDLIAANLAITRERREQIAFSIPFTATVEQIVTRVQDRPVRFPADAVGRSVVFERGTCYRESAESLAASFPGVKIEEAPDGIDTEELLYRVSRGMVDFAIADSNYIENFQAYCTGIQVVHAFPSKRYIAWGMRPDDQSLLESVNTFLKANLETYAHVNEKGDWNQIRKRRILRVITMNNPLDYFLHRGELVGFEYELAGKFAKDNGLELAMVVAPKWDDLVPWLLQGKGDLIAASVSITERRKEIPGLAFCRPYGNVREVLVARADEKGLRAPSDLAGRTIAIRKGSSYWETLVPLRESLQFRLQVVPADIEEYQIIDRVASGEYDLTVVDDVILNAERLRRSDVRGLFPIGEPRRYAWLTRVEDTELRSRVDAYFKEIYRGTFYNLTSRKYHRSAERVSQHIDAITNQGQISKYDDWIRKYADQYRFPWCLIAAQMYQESRFDPKARSGVGAVGLMQIMPAAAADVGFRHAAMSDEQNIHAGIKYLDRQRNRFKERPPEDLNTICFALACYNGGYGHIQDGVRLAREMNLDPHVWFDNVEKTVSLLSRPEYAARARYGAFRSWETVQYVRDIVARYRAYSRLAERRGETGSAERPISR